MNHETNNKTRGTGNRTRNGVLFLLGLAVLIALGVTMLQGTDAESTVDASSSSIEWYEVQRQSFELQVLARGELEAAEKVEIKCMVEGGGTITEVIKEGEWVKAGDVLARLADDDIRKRIEEEALQVEQAKSQEIAARQTLTIEQSKAESEIKAAEVKLSLAELDLAKWEKGDVPTKRRELAQALEKAKRSLVRAKRDVELSKQLYEEKFISLDELEDDQVKLLDAENALANAQLELEVYEKFVYPREKSEKESARDQAAAQLQRTRVQNESQLASAEGKLLSAIHTLKLRMERMDKFQEQLGHTVITAPKEGMLVYATSVGNRRRRGDPITQGRMVRFNESMFHLPDTSRMVADVKVHEAVLSQMKLGQSAAVTLDAKPSEFFTGEVVEIGVMAEEGNWMNQQLREYAVKIALPENQQSKLHPAMRCTARIQVGHVNESIAVPVQAVFAEGRHNFCYVPAGGNRVRKQTVEIGQSGETMVEIRQGLDVGDRVLLRRPQPGEVLLDDNADNKADDKA